MLSPLNYIITLSPGTIFISLILCFGINIQIRNHMTRRGVNPPLHSGIPKDYHVYQPITEKYFYARTRTRK